jgi:uncharacterized protein (TIRG00374 family)
MSKRKIVISALVVAALAVLVYLQFRTWTSFDWNVFWEQTGNARRWPILRAVLFIYIADVLRGLRWKIFLRPVCKTSWWRLVPAQFIGFTGVALLGRPAEVIRPYLIARKENLLFASQMAVWMVERIFDTAAFTLLVTAAIFSTPSLASLPHVHQLREGGFVLIAVVVGLTLFAVVVRRHAAAVANRVERRLSRVAPKASGHICQKLRAFGEGLNTIQDAASFLQVAGVSLAIWLLVALAYLAVTHAYPAPLEHMTTPKVLLLLGFAMVGSTVQLPAIGGGTQLASILALKHVFGVPQELSVSCGILLWLVSFVGVVPLGLVLAHREHLSLRQLSKQMEMENTAEERAKQSAITHQGS